MTYDIRHLLRLPLLSLSWLCAAEPAAAAWDPLGTPVCAPSDSCSADAQLVIPDGTGGVYIVWRDYRYPATDPDCFAQRLLADGSIAPGWAAAGIPVAIGPSLQTATSIALDTEGGLLIAMEDGRDAQSGHGVNVYMQRLRPDGSKPTGWPENGIPICALPRDQGCPSVAAGPDGSTYIAWEDSRDLLSTGQDIYAQHVLADGTLAPGWPVNGLPMTVGVNDQFNPRVLRDDSAGAVIVWSDQSNGPESNVADVVALRITPTGQPVGGWPQTGALIVEDRTTFKALRDESGGFYVACGTRGEFSTDQDYYVQRWRFDGTRASGWPDSGVVACSAPDTRGRLVAAPDGLGGILLTWHDRRFRNVTGFEIFATRILPDGSLAPGWIPDGNQVSDPPENVSFSEIAPDFFGGAYVTWEHGDPGEPGLVQHLSASGVPAPGWPPYGIQLTSAPFKGTDPRVVPDGTGGAIVVWHELSNLRLDLFAQRFLLDGPVPVQLSLVSSEVTAERVSLTWHVADGSISSAAVYRRAGSADWRWVATIESDGSGTLRYEDLDVEPGTSYGYRLGWTEDGRERLSTETWVEVPTAFTLQLAGFTPNPSTGPVTVSFTLASTSPAMLELLDVTGRRVLSRDVGSLGPGQHLVRLDDGVARLSPGMYFVRLTTSDQQLISRGAVVR